jgi:hypothetical protein
MKTINIARDFSEVPAGRFRSDGDFSGERFREDFLRPSLTSSDVVVEISGTAGYGSSFLEEAFGGLVRKGYFTASELHRKLKIQVGDPGFRTYEVAIWRFIDQAQREMADAS